jgi:hypothetical protein
MQTARAVGEPAIEAEPATPIRRPRPVTILAIIQIVSGLAYAALAATLMVDANAYPDVTSSLAATDLPVWLGVPARTLAVIVAVVAALELLAAVALLRLRQSGWTLAMLLAGASLASQIVIWWNNDGVQPLSMLLGVVTVLYLNQREVRRAFGIGTRRRIDDLDEARG